MEEGKLQSKDRETKKADKRMSTINNRLYLFAPDISKSSVRDMARGVIMEQKPMRNINLDNSIFDSNILWGKQQIAMVPRDN